MDFDPGRLRQRPPGSGRFAVGPSFHSGISISLYAKLAGLGK